MHAAAQSYRNNLSMPSVSLNAYSTKQSDIFSFVSNQASLARINQSGVGIFTEQRFLLKNNSSNQLAFVLDAKNINLGVQFNYAGFVNFNETSFGFAIGKKMSDKIDVGAQFNFISERAALYKRASAINFEIGALFHLTPLLNIGCHLYNPAGLFISSSKDGRIPAAYKFGAGYDASDEFHLNVEIYKEEDKPTIIQTGFQYQFRKNFFARFGYLSNVQQMYFSAGISYIKMTIGIHCSSHPQLGITPGISFLIKTDSKRK